LEEAESSARVIRRDGRRAWSGFHLRAGVVRVEDVLNAPGSICPDLDHRLLVDCDEWAVPAGTTMTSPGRTALTFAGS
jgi:hypothetical protein